MIKITYFVHSTTTHNEMGTAAGWLPGDLSNLGIKQSIELGNIASNKKFEVIFSSDLKRAVDTANLAFGNLFQSIFFNYIIHFLFSSISSMFRISLYLIKNL